MAGIKSPGDQPPGSISRPDQPPLAVAARMRPHHRTPVVASTDRARANRTTAVQFWRSAKNTGVIDPPHVADSRSPRNGEQKRPPAGVPVVLIRHARRDATNRVWNASTGRVVDPSLPPAATSNRHVRVHNAGCSTVLTALSEPLIYPSNASTMPSNPTRCSISVDTSTSPPHNHSTTPANSEREYP
jgi:hypothetical protein